MIKEGYFRQVWDNLEEDEGFEGENLSRASKKVLIKIVAHAIPMYTMWGFMLPSGLCREIEL